MQHIADVISSTQYTAVESLRNKEVIYVREGAKRHLWIGKVTHISPNGAKILYRNGVEQPYSLSYFRNHFAPAHWKDNRQTYQLANNMSQNYIAAGAHLRAYDMTPFFHRDEVMLSCNQVINGAKGPMHMVLNEPMDKTELKAMHHALATSAANVVSVERNEASLWCDFHPTHYALHCTKCAAQREAGIKRDEPITEDDPADEKGEFYVFRPKGDKPKHKHNSYAKATAEAARIANLFPGESIEVLRVAVVYCAERVTSTHMRVETK